MVCVMAGWCHNAAQHSISTAGTSTCLLVLYTTQQGQGACLPGLTCKSFTSSAFRDCLSQATASPMSLCFRAR
jgi:hypothetical protein